MEDTKKPTLPDIIEEVATEFCDEYCRFPFEIEDYDTLLNTKCANCPIQRLT